MDDFLVTSDMNQHGESLNTKKTQKYVKQETQETGNGNAGPNDGDHFLGHHHWLSTMVIITTKR